MLLQSDARCFAPVQLKHSFRSTRYFFLSVTEGHVCSLSRYEFVRHNIRKDVTFGHRLSHSKS